MPASASSDSSRKTGTFESWERSASPTTTQTSASSVTRCRPSTRASQGASAPNPANASTGSVVSTPAVVLLIDRARR